MKQIILVITLCIISCLSGKAFTQQEAMEEIGNATAAMTTMQCDIVQTKSMRMLGENMVSRGKLYCKQPDRLRWEYTSPYSYIFILNGTQVGIKKGHRSDVVDVNQNKLFKEIARIMMNSLLGKCLSDTGSFRAVIGQSGDKYVATLTPLKRELKQMFTNIVLYYDKDAKVISKVVLHEKNGDTTTIELTNIRENVSIDESVFQIN